MPCFVRAVLLTVIAAAVVRGMLGIYFYWAHVHGKMDPRPPHITTHDDSLLFVGALLALMVWVLEKRSWASWFALLALSVPLIHIIVLNGRRLAWVALVFALGVGYLLLPPGRLRRRRALGP